MSENYQVLYRKWRPQTFSDVYGQPLITTALKNSVKNDRLAHAYLFTGSRGTGKTSCAKIMAKAVNCLEPRDGNPCNKCTNCVGINNETILDVVEIDAASNNGVDSIRELREEVNFTPSIAKYRVYIIDEVHMLTTGAFNALLKTLEEPPAHVIFILATTEVHKLPATILSRCQRFNFERISPKDIAARIHFIAGEEDFAITDDAALLLARLADGALRDALSMLDQCLAKSKEIDEKIVADVTGMAGRDYLFKLTDAVIKEDSGKALKIISDLHKSSLDMHRLATEWIEFLRNIMIVKNIPHPEDLVPLSIEELKQLEKLSREISLEKILHCMDVLQATIQRMRLGVSRRIEMEMAVIKLCSPSLDSSNSGILRRLDAMEKAFKKGVPTTSQPVIKNISVKTSTKDVEGEVLTGQAESAETIERPAEPEEKEGPSDMMESANVESEGFDEGDFTDWAKVMEILSTDCPPLFAVLEDANAVLRGAHLLIETDNPMFKVLAGNDSNRQILAKSVMDVAGRAYKIGVRNKSVNKEETRDPLSDFIKNSKDLGVDIDLK